MTALLERILGRPLMYPGEGGDGGNSAEPQGSDAAAGDAGPTDDDAPDASEGDAPEGDNAGDGEEGDEVDGPERKAAAAQAAAEAFEEIEIDGKKLKYSPELRDYLLRQADYQRNIQQVAEERKAIRAEHERVAAASEEKLAKQGQLAHARHMLSEFAKINLEQQYLEDPQTAQVNAFRRDQWRDQEAILSRDIVALDAKADEDRRSRELETSRETERRVQEAQAVLHRDIPNWGQVAPKVAEYAMREHGFTIQQLNAIDDPRFGKLMHQAWQGHELAKKQKTAAVARTQPKLVTEVAPLVTVGAKSGGPTGRVSLDKAPMDQYVALRQKQNAAKQARR